MEKSLENDSTKQEKKCENCVWFCRIKIEEEIHLPNWGYCRLHFLKPLSYDAVGNAYEKPPFVSSEESCNYFLSRKPFSDILPDNTIIL